jgi:hypothetical protein
MPPRSRSNQQINLLNWKDRTDGSGSVAWTAHSTYEIERLEEVTGVFWFRVRRLASAKGPDIGGSGTQDYCQGRQWQPGSKAICGRAMPPSRARESTFTRGLRGLH